MAKNHGARGAKPNTVHTVETYAQAVADELQLEQLNADLLNKATQMGMVPGSGSVTLDMGQGSQSSTASHDATDSGNASSDAPAQGQAQ